MVSLIIPCYNCAEYIDAHIEKLVKFLDEQFTEWELLLVDDASKDQTKRKISEWQSRDSRVHAIILPHNSGKGAAVKAGMLESRGDFALFTDADVPYGVAVLSEIVHKLKEGADVVLGARLDNGDVAEQKKHRTLLSRVFVTLANLVLYESVPDTQAGVKGFTKEAAHTIFPIVRTSRFCFDVEVIAIAQRKGMVITNLPVVLENQGVSTVRVGLDGLGMVFDLVRIYVRTRMR